ncbi:hypothetical protein [Nocardioides sp. Soil805]|uniref:hypothetical protein n=1 Tax=Nocardioides sp. Soil805 TaxID=1736416 RepID=UPI0007036836|nr:hypothetical protein [Nocardioides sp. Soil805]KRF36828.1 hypothetical protein ASG94_05330 [Nocardioides sp. Soil805]
MSTDALRGLADLARDRTTRQGLEAQLAVARQRLADTQQRAAAAVDTLAGELADVDRLESMSMTRILAGLRGSRDTDLDRERSEAQAAQYAAAEAEARRQSADREVTDLVARINALGDLDARREELLSAREAEVAADPATTTVAGRVTELATAVGTREAELAQLDEAAVAAQHALGALREADRHLGSAGSWSTYDTFFGGGMVTDMVKYDRLDKAGQVIRQADSALGHLATELADVGLHAVGGIQVDQMTQFFDVWFDNIFSDWAVRDRIRQASDRVRSATAGVGETLEVLVRRRDAALEDLHRLRAEREQLLTT